MTNEAVDAPLGRHYIIEIAYYICIYFIPPKLPFLLTKKEKKDLLSSLSWDPSSVCNILHRQSRATSGASSIKNSQKSEFNKNRIATK